MAEKKEQIVHELIPEHSKLSEKDVKSLLKEYNITTRELPKILITDPAIGHLGVEEGDVVKIKRKSRTAGDTVFFRAVVKE
jgi:DNA-directed RNA polymerase subunit H